MTAPTSRFTTDPDLRSLLPRPTAEELANLEASLLTEGCRDALTVWAEQGVLVDGHNRHELCEKHGIPYQVVAKNFPDRAAVVAWMIREQLGRRNVTEEQKSYLRGKHYLEEKKEPHRPAEIKVESDSTLIEDSNGAQKTGDRLADQYGVTEKTIRNDAAFAETVDAVVDAAGEDARPILLGGKATKKEIRELSEMEKQEAKQQIDEIKSRKKKRRRRANPRPAVLNFSADGQGEDGNVLGTVPRRWRPILRRCGGLLRRLSDEFHELARVPEADQDHSDAHALLGKVRAVADAIEAGLVAANEAQGVG